MKLIPRLIVKTLPFYFNAKYVLASWTKKHKLFGKIIKKILFDEDYMIVVPRNSVARSIDMNIHIDSAGDRTVVPSNVVKNVLRRSDKIFIMNFCLCRRSNKCKDYPLDHGCIFIGKGTDKIPKEFGRTATPDEAIAHIDECSKLGLVHVIGRNKIDSIWLSTGNKKDLLTICNCCPCCCLWNVARNISDDIAATYKKMEGVDVSVKIDRCIGCGLCRDICFTKAVSIIDGKCTISDILCRGCGRCAEICPNEAILIEFDPEKISIEVERILALLYH